MLHFFLFSLMLGCPVGPDDVKTVDEEGPTPPANQMPGQGNMQQGNMQQGNMQQSSPDMALQGAQSGNMQQENMQQENMQQDNMQGDQMAQGLTGQIPGQNNDQANTQNGTGNGAAANGSTNDGSGAGAGQDIIPIYNSAPSFSDDLGEKDPFTTIHITVEDVENYDIEFIVAQETSGRMAPKVVHKEQSTSQHTSIIAPKNYKDKVWIVLIADVNQDGPGADDLIGGLTEPISIEDEDINLTFTLKNDESWMENLPWYTKMGDVDTPAVTTP